MSAPLFVLRPTTPVGPLTPEPWPEGGLRLGEEGRGRRLSVVSEPAASPAGGAWVAVIGGGGYSRMAADRQSYPAARVVAEGVIAFGDAGRINSARQVLVALPLGASATVGWDGSTRELRLAADGSAVVVDPKAAARAAAVAEAVACATEGEALDLSTLDGSEAGAVIEAALTRRGVPVPHAGLRQPYTSIVSGEHCPAVIAPHAHVGRGKCCGRWGAGASNRAADEAREAAAPVLAAAVAAWEAADWAWFAAPAPLPAEPIAPEPEAWAAEMAQAPSGGGMAKAFARAGIIPR